MKLNNNNCIFCRIIRGELQSTFIKETPELVVIKDIHPRAPIHYLIIPKHHLVSMKEVDTNNPMHANLILKMLAMIDELARELKAPGDYNLIINTGATAGQSVLHMHWHLLSGKNIYEKPDVI
jgi:histidine triad (HIT) family protein